MRRIALYTLVMLWALPAMSRPLEAYLFPSYIEINSGFTGTELLLYGTRNDVGDIVVIIRGPERSFKVRRKDKIAGIWVNRDQKQFNDVSSYYAIASTRPLEEIRNDYLLGSLQVGVNHLIDNNDVSASSSSLNSFKEAFLDDRYSKGLYQAEQGTITFLGDALFETIVSFPESIPRGTYTAEIYLFADGQLIGVQSTPLTVEKQGLDAFVFDFAYQYPAMYGIMAVLMALGAGWVAGQVFRRV